MITAVKETINSESGFVLVLAVLMLAVITVIGVAATRTSDTESQIASNERQIANELYNAEGALIDMLESPGTWMTISFLTDGEIVAKHIENDIDFDGDGTPDADAEIRYIEETGSSVGGLSTAANDIPLVAHTGPPPADSGYSMKHFEIRRYGVTATSTTGNTQIQTGVYKVFNK